MINTILERETQNRPKNEGALRGIKDNQSDQSEHYHHDHKSITYMRFTMVSIEETYKLQEAIKQKEQELKTLKDQYDQDINELINTDHIETKYYKINEIRRSGRSFINIPKFQELYNNEFNKVVKYSVTITDAKKVLSGDQIEKIIDKYNDTVLYEIIKKV